MVYGKPLHPLERHTASSNYFLVLLVWAGATMATLGTSLEQLQQRPYGRTIIFCYA